MHIKKSLGILCRNQQEKVDIAVTKLTEEKPCKVCRILGVRTSSYYYHKKHLDRKESSENDKEMVRSMFHYHFGNFGRRVIHNQLKKMGITISEARVNKILKKEGLISKYGRKRGKNVHTNKEISDKYIHDNLFAKLNEQDRKKEIWSMDFTEQKINGKKVYTCGIVSVNGKQLISLQTNCPQTKESAIKTVAEGIKKFGVPYMITTDRGSPFISKDFKVMIDKYKIVHSMSRPHTPIDNRYIETFWKSMKTEIGKIKHLCLGEYIMILDYYKHYYNFLRPHSTLGYCAPMQGNSIFNLKGVI